MTDLTKEDFDRVKREVVASFTGKIAAADAEYDEETLRAKMQSSGYEDEEINRVISYAGARRGTLIDVNKLLQLSEEDPRPDIVVRFTRTQRMFEYGKL